MEKEQHLLTLKVMRLSRPSFNYQSKPFIAYKSDIDASIQAPLLDSPLSQLVPNRFEAGHDLRDDMTLSSILTLPNSFGNIYLGETFCSYLCINNDSAGRLPVKNITFKAELQTATQRFMLYDSLANAPADSPGGLNLLPNQTVEFIITHEIKELAVHILVCTINSSAPYTDEVKSFRKFYKFQVLNPLSVKTKINSIATGAVFLEAQIQNLTLQPMHIDRLTLQPSVDFSVFDLNVSLTPASIATAVAEKNLLDYGSEDEVADPNVFSTESYLSPQDIRQYLFMLSPVQQASSRSLALGKLDILWRLGMGEVGRLQTSQLMRKPSQSSNTFECKVIASPKHVSVYSTFSLSFQIFNTTEIPLSITAVALKDAMTSLLLCGLASRHLGVCQPGATLEFSLEFYSIVAGVVRLDGLRLTDADSGLYFDIIDCKFDLLVVRATK